MSTKENPKEKMARLKRQKEQEGKKPAIKSVSNRYQILQQIGKGVSSHVSSAINIYTGKKVAIKKIKNFLENKHESLRILREILLLRKLKHPNIINMNEILIEDTEGKQLSLVLEFLPTDIRTICRSNKLLSIENIKKIVFQILLGLNYCHQSQVLHRDLKPENILVTADLSEVKLCDFGLARAVAYLDEEKEESEMKNQNEQKHEQKMEEGAKGGRQNIHLTAHVSTRWYRAPELILLQRKYNSAIDMWSVGCILGQLLTMTSTFTKRQPLFPGKACYPLSPPKSPDMNYKKINDFPHSVYDQLSMIFRIIGTPKEIDFITDERAKNYIRSFGVKEPKPFKQIFQFVSPQIEDFLMKTLEFNPNKRMTISEAIKHPFFDEIRSQYEKNLEIKGEPIEMDLEGLDTPQIRDLVMKEYDYYQSINANEGEVKPTKMQE